MAPPNPLKQLITLLWGDRQTNQLWQRIVKYTIGTTAAMIIAIVPACVSVLGPYTFLVPMTTVFAHPAQRLGLMVESLLMLLLGGLLGLAWSILGLWLSSFVFDIAQPTAYAIRGVFLLVSVLVHGVVRSSSPRLFNFVWFMLVASVLVLLGDSDKVTKQVFTDVYYPMLLGGAVLLPANLLIFPEISSSFLGATTIHALVETMDTFSRATSWFITPGGDIKDPRQQHGLLDRAMSGGRSSNTAKRSKTGFWTEFLTDFPNPFQKNKAPSQPWPAAPSFTTLASMTSRKANLRAQLSRCKAAQEEVNYEISISCLPPTAMRPISVVCMTDLVQSIIILIGACENKFFVLDAGRVIDTESQDVEERQSGQKTGVQTPSVPTSPRSSSRNPTSGGKNVAGNEADTVRKVESIKPLRDLGTSNIEHLESILACIRDPVQEMQQSLQDAVVLLTTCLAYSFDVSKLPSGTFVPTGVSLEELDLRIDIFTDAIAVFDKTSEEGLRKAAMDDTYGSLDLMPRTETFLVASFIMGFCQAAKQLLAMLRQARILIEQRHARNNKSRLRLPHYANIRLWLLSGGESGGMARPEAAWKSVLRGYDTNPSSVVDDADSCMVEEQQNQRTADEEAPIPLHQYKQRQESRNIAKRVKPNSRPSHGGSAAKIRGRLADGLDFVSSSRDFAYALKLAVAMMIVSWPALLSSWNQWYFAVRGIWAPTQLILVFEVAIGASLFIFVVRLVGVIFGCVIGFAAYEIGRGNRVAIVILILFGLVPSIYVQLATKYVKAGMISIVSMAVVALAAANHIGAPLPVFYERMTAFVVGGVVAVAVEILVYPARARDRLVESLSASVRQVQKMQNALAVGIDGPERPSFRSHSLHIRFNRARDKAQGALGAAETFLPFCLTEPRLKGSFKTLAPIYRQVIYVLHQIIDRMDNVIQLRKAYGSSILEDLNSQVFTYRRNAAAGVILMLFSMNEALTTRLPLPQFIPSARVAQIRLVNRVREVLAEASASSSKAGFSEGPVDEGQVDEQTARVITQRKFLSWSANTAGQMEIVEYLEELVELVKLLVGVSTFTSGIFEKATFDEAEQQATTREHELGNGGSVRSSASIVPQDGERVMAAPSATMQPPSSPRGTATMLHRSENHSGTGGSVEVDAVADDNGEINGRGEDPKRKVNERTLKNNAAMRRRGFTKPRLP